MNLKILSYNTLFGGRDGADDRRAKAQIALIRDLKPDVFLMQEAKGFHDGGGVLLHAWEASIGMRGFLALAPRTGQNVAIFVRESLKPLAFQPDSDHFHHCLASLKVALPGTDRVLTLMSAHLCPNGPLVRRREAAYLAVQAAPDALVLLTGDFNSASPHDAEPEGFETLASHHRARYLADDLRTADRSVLAHLEAAGWVDIGDALNASSVPTVPTVGFANTEFAVMRCDYVLTTALLASYVVSYEVIRNDTTGMASDHYPVAATFEIPV